MAANKTYQILVSEVRVAWRSLCVQFVNHPLMVVFFIGATLAMTSTIVALMNWAITNEDLKVNPELVSPETDVLLLFMVMLFRAAVTTQRRVVRNPVMSFYRCEPVKEHQVMMATLGYVVVSILALVAMGGVLFVAALLVTGVRPQMPPLLLPQVMLTVLLAPLMGYFIGVFAALQPLARKAGYLMVVSVLMAVTIAGLNLGVEAPGFTVALLLLVTMLLMMGLPLVSGLLTEVHQTHTESGGLHDPETTTHAWVSWLAHILNWQVYVVARKEILNALRERDVISAIITSLAIGGVLVVLLWLKLPQMEVESVDATLMLPIFLAMSLFLGALLHCAMLGAASIGSESKRLWLLKSLPVKARLVLRGKAVAMIFLAFPSMLFILLPMPVLAGFPWQVILFFFLVATILVLALTGLGLYMGTLFANFDEANRGQPDFMAQFMIMTFAAILAILLLILPAAIMWADRSSGGLGYLGLATALIMTGAAYGIYRSGLSGAARAYRRIDIEAYG